MPIKKLKLETLVIDAGTDVRSEINDDTVSEYGLAAKNKAKLPPLVVFDTKDGLLLADGFHRYFGFERQGIKEYDCDVRKGTREDAIKYALGCNTTHGLRRTNADKRNSCVIALKEFPKLSNRALAEICAVHHDLVADVREQVEEKTEREILKESSGQVAESANSNDVSDSKSGPPPRREGADGKSYPVPPRKTSAIPARPEKPVETLDATGIPVPEEIVPFWDATFSEAQRLITLTSEIRVRIKRAQETNEPAFREVDHTDILAKLDQVYADLKRAKPYAVCPSCNGVMTHKNQTTAKASGSRIATSGETCGTCKGRGFVSEHFWKTCVPEETKAITGRA